MGGAGFEKNVDFGYKRNELFAPRIALLYFVYSFRHLLSVYCVLGGLNQHLSIDYSNVERGIAAWSHVAVTGCAFGDCASCVDNIDLFTKVYKIIDIVNSIRAYPFMYRRILAGD